MHEVENVEQLINFLQNNCNKSDKVYLKLWSTDLKKNVAIKTEDNEGYPYNGYIVITADE